MKSVRACLALASHSLHWASIGSTAMHLSKRTMASSKYSVFRKRIPRLYSAWGSASSASRRVSTASFRRLSFSSATPRPTWARLKSGNVRMTRSKQSSAACGSPPSTSIAQMLNCTSGEFWSSSSALRYAVWASTTRFSRCSKDPRFVHPETLVGYSSVSASSVSSASSNRPRRTSTLLLACRPCSDSQIASPSSYASSAFSSLCKFSYASPRLCHSPKVLSSNCTASSRRLRASSQRPSLMAVIAPSFSVLTTLWSPFPMFTTIARMSTIHVPNIFIPFPALAPQVTEPLPTYG
mmetsp:Transcript_36283/g.102229  ORF Transcript_36283/g.102229 Transcript_36283/m.102229 type:complete len:295 (-) Transcript_36283:74-958(-)